MTAISIARTMTRERFSAPMNLTTGRTTEATLARAVRKGEMGGVAGPSIPPARASLILPILPLVRPTDLLRRRESDGRPWPGPAPSPCLLYTSDAADDLTRVDLGGGRIIH